MFCAHAKAQALPITRRVVAPSAFFWKLRKRQQKIEKSSKSDKVFRSSTQDWEH